MCWLVIAQRVGFEVGGAAGRLVLDNDQLGRGLQHTLDGRTRQR